ncbi:MAG: PD40 domain-containing protein [Chitinophagaceae bacterium]|nr:PD40 domain-containing protein [Chitinophagaceae bacterium]
MKSIFISTIWSIVLFFFIQSENALASSRRDTLMAGIQDLCWSPDGQTIYFSGLWHNPDYSDFKPENWSIYKYDFKNKITTKFIDSAYYVAVSPSGKNIATGKIHNGNRDIYIYDINGEKINRITSHPKVDYIASFSPNGKKILFNSTRNGKADIYVVNIDSTGLKRLTFSTSDSSYNSPQWSPNGKKIVYYLGVSKLKDQLYVMNADGSNKVNISNDSLQNFYPSWISKNKIIYTQRRNEINHIFSNSPKGNHKKLFLQAESFYARISANGKMIAYIDQKEHCIKVVSLSGELIVRISLI